MSGRSKLALINSVITFIIMSISSIILIPKFGAFGAAIALTITTIIINVIRFFQVFILENIHPVISAPVEMDQEEVARIFRKYDIYILPVIDKENHLLGRITVDDIIDVIDEEASEDVYKMVGLENEDKVFTSPFSSVRKRLPWLTLNLFTALLVSSVVGIFEGTIARLSFLAVLMPIIAGMSSFLFVKYYASYINLSNTLELISGIMIYYVLFILILYILRFDEEDKVIFDAMKQKINR